MRIVLANEGPRIEASAIGLRPLGGVETAVALLAQSFQRRGHEVILHFEGERARLPATADLVIAARVPRLFGALPRGRRVLWLHNPAGYLRKPRHAWPILRARPVIVTLGRYHAATVPGWLPGPRAQIPLAVAPPFDVPPAERAPPPPIAVFTSNPLRGLDELAGLWPRIGRGELHAYSGAATYGGDPRLAQRAAPILARAEATPGVRLFAPLPRPELQARLGQARCMLYPGDPGETFCLALAEAQAVGLPCVVMDRGAVAERIEEGLTGMVARSEAEFIAAAQAVLGDDALWLRLHRAALARGPGPNWTDIAQAFEALA
ncbi:glycosyltransferase [Sediminicoccus sp. KRV36]|uniref:glycosyltransferase n=1 Tax=Sediminicoccus sp. KRV36 TaxID=3133721 RepID=UPI00200EB2AC|nr:glycosyltransferase [Sediminicoccus rosea]UPY37854.1 glycosyltransferase [Sediminicoccus rosea]